VFDLDVKILSPEVLRKKMPEQFVISEVSEEKESSPKKRDLKAIEKKEKVPVYMKKPKIEPRMLKRFKTSEIEKQGF